MARHSSQIFFLIIKLIEFIQRHTVVTLEALDTCVNELPRVATRQCGGRESNPRPVNCKSSALTTKLPSRTDNGYNIYHLGLNGRREISTPPTPHMVTFTSPLPLLLFITCIRVCLKFDNTAARIEVGGLAYYGVVLDSTSEARLTVTVSLCNTGQLSLAIPPRVGANEYWRRLRLPLGKNREFCVTVAPVTRTAGIRTQLVKGAGC